MGSNKITGLANGTVSGDAIAFGQAFTSGNLTFSPTTAGIVGVTDGSVAAAGNVGERVVSSVASFINMTASTAQFGNLTSISLTAGSWDINAIMIFAGNGATITNVYEIFVSTFSGNTVTDVVPGDNNVFVGVPIGGGSGVLSQCGGSIPSWHVNLTSTTTIYLKAIAFFSAGTPQNMGRISATRIR
jgi:hypothetical protein